MAGLKSEVDILYNALVNGPNVTLTRYPVGAAGQALTASGKTTGAFKYAAAGANQVQVTGLTAALNTAGVWVAGGVIYTPSILTDCTWVLWIGRGTVPAAVLAAEVQWGVDIDVTVITAVGEYAVTIVAPAIMLPIPVFVTAGVGVAMQLATDSIAADHTANGQIFAYTGLGA